LYNLAGNAWEWIEDNYVEPYNTTAVTDPLVLETGSTSRCWRGGSWNYHEATLQTAIRFAAEENRGNDHFGFRVCKALATSIGTIDIQKERKLLKITDLLGRETNQINQPLFYIYDDGTVEKRIIIE